MVAIFPDGQYDHASFQNANDRVMYERTFARGSAEQQLVAQAMLCANPEMSNDEIRMKMTVPTGNPPMYVAPPVTIDTVLSGEAMQPPQLYDRAPTDFSGTPAGRDGSQLPSLPAW